MSPRYGINVRREGAVVGAVIPSAGQSYRSGFLKLAAPGDAICAAGRRCTERVLYRISVLTSVVASERLSWRYYCPAHARILAADRKMELPA